VIEGKRRTGVSREVVTGERGASFEGIEIGLWAMIESSRKNILNKKKILGGKMGSLRYDSEGWGGID